MEQLPYSTLIPGEVTLICPELVEYSCVSLFSATPFLVTADQSLTEVAKGYNERRDFAERKPVLKKDEAWLNINSTLNFPVLLYSLNDECYKVIWWGVTKFHSILFFFLRCSDGFLFNLTSAMCEKESKYDYVFISIHHYQPKFCMFLLVIRFVTDVLRTQSRFLKCVGGSAFGSEVRQ